MKLCVMALYDGKVRAFSAPFFSPSEEAGVRAVLDQARGGGNETLNRHPEDFTIYRLGIYDDADGALVGEPPHSLGLVSGFLNKEV